MKKPNVYAKHALLEMHATLAGEMQLSNEHYFKLVKQMREIESVTKMMDPTFKISRIAVRRMQPNGWFKRGTITRLRLDILRKEARPLTAREIVDRAFISRGLDPDAEKAAKVKVVFHNALRNQVGISIQIIRDGPHGALAANRQGLTGTVVGEGSLARWELKGMASEGMTHANHSIGSKS